MTKDKEVISEDKSRGNIPDLLEACFRVGVTLAAGDGGTLKVSPAGKMTEEIKASLKEHKTGVLSVLALREIYKKAFVALTTDQFIAMGRAADAEGSDLWPRFIAIDRELVSLRDGGECPVGQFKEKCEKVWGLFLEAERKFGK